MQVFLSFTGRTVTLSAKCTDSVADFRARVQDSEGVPPDSQILICRGKLLENGRMLADYCVTEQTTVLLRLRLLSATVALVTIDPASSAEDRYASFDAVVASSTVPNAGVSLKPAFAVVFNKSAEFTGSVAVDGGAYILSRLVKEDRVCIIELQPHLMTLNPKQLREALEAGRRKGHAGSDDCRVTTTIGLGADAPAVPCITAFDAHAPHVLRVEPAIDLRPGTLYALVLFHLKPDARRLGVGDDWFIPFRTAPRPVPRLLPASSHAAVAAAVLSAFICSICFESCRHPVPTLCGHCFCRSHLTEWAASQRADGATPTCPLCRTPLFVGHSLHCNHGIAAAIAEAENLIAGGPSAYAFVAAVDLTCTVCLRTCVEPVAAPCGHSLCLQHLDVAGAVDGVPQPRMREASSHCAHGYHQYWYGGRQSGCELCARDVRPLRHAGGNLKEMKSANAKGSSCTCCSNVSTAFRTSWHHSCGHDAGARVPCRAFKFNLKLPL